MCRLYGFRSNEPTKVECTLVHAQNALMVQSREDLAGTSHGHGWGLATYGNHQLHVERQAWAAYHGEHFKRAAARVFACTVLAHVRRATVGPPALENTHPFAEENWAFAHNGTVPHFDRLRPMLCAALPPAQRAAIAGATDSEHVFRLMLSLHGRAPVRSLLETVRLGVQQVADWCRDIDAQSRLALNLLLTDGEQLVGTRLGRSLFFVERQGVYDCEVCGFPHVHHDPKRDYRAVVIASEPLTHEGWQEVPEGSIYRVTPELRLEVSPL